MDQVPSTLGGLLSWLASGAGIGLVLLWISSVTAWNITATDSPLVVWLKKLKPFILVVIGSALGIGASLGTTYIPAGVIENLEPAYKIVWTVVMIVVSMGAGQVVVFRARVWRTRHEAVLTKELGLTLDPKKTAWLSSPRPVRADALG